MKYAIFMGIPAVFLVAGYFIGDFTVLATSLVCLAGGWFAARQLTDAARDIK